MEPATQHEVAALWNQVTTENLFSITDYASFKQEFRALFGFEVPGVDYAQAIEDRRATRAISRRFSGTLSRGPPGEGRFPSAGEG